MPSPVSPPAVLVRRVVVALVVVVAIAAGVARAQTNSAVSQSLVYAEDRLFISGLSADGREPEFKCYNASNPAAGLLWRYPKTPTRSGRPTRPGGAEVYHSMVYVIEDCVVRALHVANGAQTWSRDLRRDAHLGCFEALDLAPELGYLYVATDTRLVCLSMASGEEVWHYTPADSVLAETIEDTHKSGSSSSSSSSSSSPASTLSIPHAPQWPASSPHSHMVYSGKRGASLDVLMSATGAVMAAAHYEPAGERAVQLSAPQLSPSGNDVYAIESWRYTPQPFNATLVRFDKHLRVQERVDLGVHRVEKWEVAPRSGLVVVMGFRYVNASEGAWPMSKIHQTLQVFSPGETALDATTTLDISSVQPDFVFSSPTARDGEAMYFLPQYDPATWNDTAATVTKYALPSLRVEWQRPIDRQRTNETRPRTADLAGIALDDVRQQLFVYHSEVEHREANKVRVVYGRDAAGEPEVHECSVDADHVFVTALDARSGAVVEAPTDVATSDIIAHCHTVPSVHRGASSAQLKTVVLYAGIGAAATGAIILAVGIFLRWQVRREQETVRALRALPEGGGLLDVHGDAARGADEVDLDDDYGDAPPHLVDPDDE